MKQQQSSMKNTFQNKLGCIIMASGVSKRFGSNKLLVKIDGKNFLERVVEKTAGHGFAKRMVVTRTPEAVEICKDASSSCEKEELEVILHQLPGRNDAVRLGIEAMENYEKKINSKTLIDDETLAGCMFCPCDQPLLRKESIEALVEAFVNEGKEDSIYRLGWGDKPGMPVIFGRKYFEELKNLPEKKGGSHVIENHKDAVKVVQVADSMELFDVDTPEDLDEILAINR